MKAEYINPFIRSVGNTFQTMLACKTERGEMSVGRSPNGFPISGVIGLSGKAVGSVVIELSEVVAIKAASAMLMMELSKVDDDVLDAVGELANMVAGAAKVELNELEMSVSLPNIILGDQHEIRWPTACQPICIPFESDFGPFRLVVGLAECDDAS